MLHRYLSGCENAHFAVASNHDQSVVLIQLGDEFGEQVRLLFSKDEAIEFANLILDRAEEIATDHF